ncbi:hypothetical protein AURDEDRAFT_161896 [Auricularia subglabra TFB-10046 SS5]|nr:hypothetical protein AURDEDRAFT_161896 [Auricularia subglabra TFB-10046 SS5]
MCEKPEEVMPRKLRYDRGRTCNKCKSVPGAIVVRHYVYCKDCFFAHVHAKFRKVMPARETYKPRSEPGDPPLTLAFSAGLGASVLLDLVARTYRREGARKLVWDPITAIYVETCAAYDGVSDRTEHIREVLGSYTGVRLVAARIEDAFKPRDGEPLLAVSLADERLPTLSPSSPASSPTDALHAYLDAMHTPSARITAIESLVYALIMRAAPSRGPILFGTQLTALAVTLIAGVAHGAGFTLTPPPRVVRPLQDVGAKECADSITGLTREFMTRLDRDFPSTVSAVARTCAKVVPRRDQTGQLCALCERPAQRGVLDWKSRTAMRSLDPPDPNAVELDGAAGDMCYACHTMLTSRARVRASADSNQVVPVPTWATSTLLERRAALRESVREFILEDADDAYGP